MADAVRPVLQKPPGYRDPSVTATTARPPKKPQLPPALRNPGKPSRRYQTGRSCGSRLCCCLFILTAVIFALLAIAAGIGYLWFRPHFPLFRVENVTVSVFNITSSRSDGTFLDATAIIKIQAANPNSKLGLSYRAAEGRVAVADEDGDVDLGTGPVTGFTLGRKNSTELRFTAAAKRVVVDDSAGARLKARYEDKDIEFMVELRTKVGLVVNGKSTTKFPIRVDCAALSLKQISNSRRLPKCDLDFFNGIC